MTPEQLRAEVHETQDTMKALVDTFESRNVSPREALVAMLTLIALYHSGAPSAEAQAQLEEALRATLLEMLKWPRAT